MAQQIKGFQPSEEFLRMSEMAQGTPGMGTGVRPGANALDGGAISKVKLQSQPSTNGMYLGQSSAQNLTSALPQQQAGAMGVARAEIAKESNADYKAQQQLSRTVSEIMYANDRGNATFAMGVPAVAAQRQQDAAVQTLIASGMGQLPMSSNKFAA